MYCRWVAAGQLVRSTYITVCTADMNILNQSNQSSQIEDFHVRFSKDTKNNEQRRGKEEEDAFHLH
jgi:hypothetical protein